MDTEIWIFYDFHIDSVCLKIDTYEVVAQKWIMSLISKINILNKIPIIENTTNSHYLNKF